MIALGERFESVGGRSRPPRSWPVYVVGAQGLLLVGVGLVGLLRNARAPVTAATEVHVIGFQLNSLHSAVLLATGIFGLAVVVWTRLLQNYLVGQLLLYVVLFLYGTSVSAGSPRETFLNVNSADNFLHAGLCVLALVLLLHLGLTRAEAG